MKTLSLDDAKRRAMALGAKIETQNGTFNAARLQNTVTPIKKVVVPVAPIVPTEVTSSKEERTLQTIAQMTKIQSKVLLHLRTQAAQQPAIREWDFTINRDAKGNLVSIKAIAQ